MTFEKRITALIEKWLARLEKDADDPRGLQPAYRLEDEGPFEWADWRLKLMQTVREGVLTLKELRRETPAQSA